MQHHRRVRRSDSPTRPRTARRWEVLRPFLRVLTRDLAVLARFR
ncbi:hypothetical protein ACFXPI_27180 [Streptomyces sp. NPDC059104]